MPAIGPALAFNKLGDPQAVLSASGRYVLSLPRATGNTNPSDPNDYVMGGSPTIVVQQI